MKRKNTEVEDILSEAIDQSSKVKHDAKANKLINDRVV